MDHCALLELQASLLVVRPHLEVIHGDALRHGQRDRNLHVVYGEGALLAIGLTHKPVVVYAMLEQYQITLFELQIGGFAGGEVEEGIGVGE